MRQWRRGGYRYQRVFTQSQVSYFEDRLFYLCWIFQPVILNILLVWSGHGTSWSLKPVWIKTSAENKFPLMLLTQCVIDQWNFLVFNYCEKKYLVYLFTLVGKPKPKHLTQSSWQTRHGKPKLTREKHRLYIHTQGNGRQVETIKASKTSHTGVHTKRKSGSDMRGRKWLQYKTGSEDTRQ